MNHFAQEPEPPKAVLTAKFIRANCEQVLVRIDNYLISLQSDPNAIGYILINGKPKITYQAEHEVENWIKMKAADRTRIRILKGDGSGEKAEIELWLVPPGADPPEVTQTELSEGISKSEKVITNPNAPYIFSSEYYDGIAGCGNNNELDLEGYAQTLKDNPKSRGNIFILLLSKAEFRQKEREILSYLTKKRIVRKRLKTFYVKTYGWAELWILP